MGFLFLWSVGIETFPFLCFFLLLGFIKLKEIFLTNNSWTKFKENYEEELREVEIQEVEKIFSCDNPQYGYKTWKCPNCGYTKRILFRCKSRLCSRCGKTFADQWARAVEKKLLPVTHRHMVFTISNKLWPLIKQNRYLYGTLFKAVKRTIDRLFQARYPAEYIKVGLICVLHTGGKDLKFNVHIHAIVTEGGLNETNEWKSYTYFPFAQLRGIWKYEVLTGLKTDFDPMNSPDPQQFYGIIEDLFLDRTLDFYVRAKDRLFHGKGLLKYIVRYLRHPAIAEYRIVKVEGDQVTFWYEQQEEDSDRKKRYYVTMSIDEFIWALLHHIPDRNFRMIRYYGLYANRLRKIAKAVIIFKKTLAIYQDIAVQILLIEQMEQEALNNMNISPNICPQCGNEMELIEIYIPPSKPPPKRPIQTSLDQDRIIQDNLSLVQHIISKNHRYYPKGIPLRIILEDASQYALSEPLCKRIIDHLVQKGYIYRPQKNYYLPVT